MQPVTSLSMCRELIGGNRKRIGTVITNCFAMVSSFDPFIEEGRLYYEESPDGLCLFTDEQRYFQLFYFLDPASDFPRLRKEKPVLIEEINVRGGRDEAIVRAASWYGSKGFRLFKRNGYYSCTVKPEEVAQIFQERTERIRREGWNLREAKEPELVDQVIALWEGSLDPTDIPLEHRRFAGNKMDRVLCAVNRTQVLGAVWYRPGKNTCEERHITVHPDVQRRGLGTLLLLGVLNAAASTEKTVVNTWISDTNAASIAMHGWAGFQPQLRNCTQFILQEE